MIYLRDATFVDYKSLALRRGHLKVEPGVRGKARFVKRIPPQAKVLDCAGKFVTKSFVIGHHHIYSALARGMPAPKKTPRNFMEILKYVWWNLDKKLDLDMIGASALAAAVEAAKCGTTFIIDHHSSPNDVTGTLHVIADAFDSVGVSHLLCYELSDRDGAKRLQRGLDETEYYLQKRQGLVGLHASFTVSDKLLQSASLLARRHGTGLHVHVAEAVSDQEHCKKTYRKRVLERFAEAGVLSSPKTILAHGIHLNDRERKLFKRSKAWLAQSPESNQNNNVGNFDPKGLGDRVFLGTDGMHSDMIRSASAAYLAGRVSPLAAYRRLRRAHDYLSENGFTGDGPNNLVVLDYASPTPVTPSNWPGHFIYGLSRAHIDSVIANGRLIVRKGKVLTVDEEKVLKYSRKQAARLWRKL